MILTSLGCAAQAGADPSEPRAFKAGQRASGESPPLRVIGLLKAPGEVCGIMGCSP